MLRYIGASAVANAFSVTPGTRRSYRSLANGLETWRRTRSGLPDWYIQRVRSLISQVDRYLQLSPGDAVLEIGTGYVHWESFILSLVADVEATMFDVVDNRLFPVFKLYVSQLEPHLDTIGLPTERLQSSKEIVAAVRNATSFEEIYSKFSWHYVVDESGAMGELPDNTFDFVVSADVLEHIDRSILPSFMDRMFQLMRPGAYTYHLIDLMDHLSNFDSKAPAKLYYRFDGATWDRWVNSNVQYINRVQRPKWLELFRQAGFEFVSEEAEYGTSGIASVHPSYSYLSQQELDTNKLTLVFRKPT
jgi:SAM-dependent methyltransferase